MAPVVVDLSAVTMQARMFDALTVFVSAMEFPDEIKYQQAPVWAEHITQPGWQAVAAAIPEDGQLNPKAAPLVAIGYGYHGAPQQWWHQQVLGGIRRTGWPESAAHELLSDYFELTELHVHPTAQGHGLGEAMLVRLLRDRTERAVLLCTREVEGEDNRAWRLYRRYGFTEVLRNFVFSGDTRQFAVLGRTLPLDTPAATLSSQTSLP